jgi:hypothetical protein
LGRRDRTRKFIKRHRKLTEWSQLFGRLKIVVIITPPHRPVPSGTGFLRQADGKITKRSRFGHQKDTIILYDVGVRRDDERGSAFYHGTE